MADQGGLEKYNAKRDFSKTAEPAGKVAKNGGYRYLIQKHAATRLHYDFRLELDGVLKSWAVTRGPSFNPADKRLAVQTEDHPVDYGDFEGTIPKGEYGGGTVMLWDQGTWEPVGDPHEGLEKGDLKFRLHGERLTGEWVLARMRSRPEDRGRSNWLLIKHRDDVSNADDAEAWLETQASSIVSGRTMDEITEGNDEWRSGHAEKKTSKSQTSGSKKKPASPARNRSGQVSFIEPELATLADAMPAGGNWVHELKFDGYRVQVLIDGDGVRLLTRKGLDWSHRFPPLPRLFDRLDVQSAIIDGEVVAANPDGSHSFKTLQAVLGEEKSDAPLQYYAFDLLHLNGEDLTGLPLTERKARLQTLLQGADVDGRIIYSEHFTDRDDAFLHQVCGLDMEGLISKRADAAYTRGRGKSWLKVKCHKRQEFAIGGFTQPTHAHRGVGAILLGYYDKGEFIYAGKCGTGFNLEDSMDLRRRLDELVLPKSKTGAFTAVPPEVRREANYVTPKLVCEIEFTEWTPDGRLRHPSFQGLREDKPAKDVGRDKPIHTETAVLAEPKPQSPAGNRFMTAKKSKGADVGGITITHPERVVYPADNVTKLDVAEYYHAVANHILPHIVNRPISMIRCPEGIGEQCFFQRHLSQGRVEHVHDTGIEVNGRNEEYVMIDDIHGLISLAQWGVMEIHPWGCKAYEPDLPDRMIFDLDPDPESTWKDVTDGAAEVRARMQEFGLKSFLKTTGGKGLHVVVPIKPKFHWDAIKAFTRAVAQSMAHDNPKRYIATASKTARKGKIFIDYLRNDHTATAVSAYSLRARPGAPVAMPVEWEDLGANLKPLDFNIRTAAEVLKGRKHDPWADIFKLRQTLPAKVLEALKIPAE
jgi:bifunctional non-homologous end joining protein LigD